MARLLPLLLCATALALAGCGDDDSESSAGSEERAEAAEASNDTGPGDCEEVDGPKAKPDGGAQRPSSKLVPV